MKLMYNPSHLGDRIQILKSFLVGSLITSSFILWALTESPVIFIGLLALMLVGVILFFDTNLTMVKVVYLVQNLFFTLVGAVVAIIFYLWGMLLPYFMLIVILSLLVWVQRIRLKFRPRKAS